MFGIKKKLMILSKMKKTIKTTKFIWGFTGKGFNIFNSKKGFNVGVLNLMGNVFMKKCENILMYLKNF